MLHPPCTHQVLSDVRATKAKQGDGRAFWGIALFIHAWCVRADRVVVEQPPTLIPDFYISPKQRLRPCDVGDGDSKQIHLFERGGRLLIPRISGAQGTSGHKRLRDFHDSDDRDRWRSSWARFPKLCAALVQAVDLSAPPAEDLVYEDEIERFACAWHDSGLPLPADYRAPDAQPVSMSDREYQAVRGRGDGRRILGVVPLSRRRECLTLPLQQLGMSLSTHAATHACRSNMCPCHRA